MLNREETVRTVFSLPSTGLSNAPLRASFYSFYWRTPVGERRPAFFQFVSPFFIVRAIVWGRCLGNFVGRRRALPVPCSRACVDGGALFRGVFRRAARFFRKTENLPDFRSAFDAVRPEAEIFQLINERDNRVTAGYNEGLLTVEARPPDGVGGGRGGNFIEVFPSSPL